MFASRFGLVKLIMRYGLSGSFDQIPKDFPQIKYLYVALAVYTVLFAILTYIIYRYCERTAKEQDRLQEEVVVAVSYTECMNVLMSQYQRSSINDAKINQKLQTLSRMIASMPPAIARDLELKSEVSSSINYLQTLLSDDCSREIFSAAIDKSYETIESVKRRCVNIKY